MYKLNTIYLNVNNTKSIQWLNLFVGVLLEEHKGDQPGKQDDPI